jgi:hypothetical protein
MIFNFHLPVMFVFFFWWGGGLKNSRTESCTSFEDLLEYNYHGTTLTGASFTSTSDV